MLGERATLGYCAVTWLLAALAFGLLDVRAGVLLLLYPLLVLAVAVGNVAVDRAYWWYPAIFLTISV